MLLFLMPPNPHKCDGPECPICQRDIRLAMGLCPFCGAESTMIEHTGQMNHCEQCARDWLAVSQPESR